MSRHQLHINGHRLWENIISMAEGSLNEIWNKPPVNFDAECIQAVTDAQQCLAIPIKKLYPVQDMMLVKFAR